MSYSGDVSCQECWEVLQSDPAAQLLDVRTVPEWNFVGLPDLSGLGKRAITIDWQQFPSMQVNPRFVEAVDEAIASVGGDKQTAIYCICRSGVRSISSAVALTGAGYKSAFNIVGGFEGDRNEAGHRGQLGGWKYQGLPWVQN